MAETAEPSTLAEMHAAETAAASKTAESSEPSPEKEVTKEPETETAETQTEEAEAETEDSIRSWLQNELKYDASHYASDEEAMKGLVEKARLAGRHDEDAEFGKAVRQLNPDQKAKVLAMIRGEVESAPTKVAEENGKGVPDFDPAWRYQITTNKESGEYEAVAGAPRDVVDKLRKYMEWREKRLDEIVRDPDSYVAKAVAAKTADLEKITRATVEQELSRHQLAGTMQAWESENRSILYTNGKDQSGGLTPIGQEIIKVDAELLNDGMTNPITRLNRAKEIAVLKHQKATPPAKKLPNRVVRKPAIAPTRTQEDKTVDDLFAEPDADLLSVFTKLQKQEA